MSLLKKQCSNVTKARAYMSIVMASFEEEDIINNECLNELIKYHPTKQIENVEWLKMKRPPNNFRTLSLHYKNSITGEVDNISWHMCITNLYGRWNSSKAHIADVKKAFRHDSYNGTTRVFRRNNTTNGTGICDDCKITTPDIEVDHYPLPFKEIIKTFRKDNVISLSQVQCTELHNTSLILTDRSLSNRWVEYHDSVATYRLLCRSCNRKNGSYGF